jgi:hypothetical protein
MFSQDPIKGSETVFKLCFETLYQGLRMSSLHTDADAILLRHLPSVVWWRLWDSCYRLKLAVVRAYTRGGLDAATLMELTAEPDINREMYQAVQLA